MKAEGGMMNAERRTPILGCYTADDLQKAMRAVLTRAARRARMLEGRASSRPSSASVSFDARPNGLIVPL